MNPEEFLSLARRLARGSGEAEWRTSASRAYYAAFHLWRGVAEERVGLPGFGTADDHRELIAAVRFIDRDAAANLLLLRNERNDADYTLDRRFTVARAEFALDLASALWRTP